MIRIQLDLDPPRESLYEEAVSRLRDVELTDTGADALVTGAVERAGASGLPCLWDQPEASLADDLSPLASARIMPGHEWRYNPNVLPVHESNASGQLGDPGLLRIHHWLPDVLDPARAAFAQVDLAHWFFGAAPVRTHLLRAPDYWQLHLAYPNDGMALLDVATRRPTSDPYYSMHLIGSTGAAYADDHRNSHLLFEGNGTRALLHGQNRLLGIQKMLQEFVSGIRDNRPWAVTVADTQNAFNTIKKSPDV